MMPILRPLTLVLFCLVVSGLISTSAASAANIYLRPNGDNAGTSWSVSGAASAWDALNDPVTESQTPSNADYISYVGGLDPA